MGHHSHLEAHMSPTWALGPNPRTVTPLRAPYAIRWLVNRRFMYFSLYFTIRGSTVFVYVRFNKNRQITPFLSCFPGKIDILTASQIFWYNLQWGFGSKIAYQPRNLFVPGGFRESCWSPGDPKKKIGKSR